MTRNSRREFIKTLAVGLASAGVFRALTNPAIAAPGKAEPAKDVPLPPGEKKVVETDALPKALGFKHDVKDVDYKKYPKRKEKANQNQFCDNCSLYVKVNDGWGKCTMMANAGVVAAKGWCGSWSKKA